MCVRVVKLSVVSSPLSLYSDGRDRARERLTTSVATKPMFFSALTFYAGYEGSERQGEGEGGEEGSLPSS